MYSVSEFVERYPNDGDTKNPLILIPSYENGVYLENCVSQLIERGLNRYLVVDGGSQDEGTVELLNRLDKEGRVLIVGENPGPRYFFENQAFYRSLPNLFCVTDPDLEFNPGLPVDFLDTLFTLSEELKVGKVGFALSLDGDLSSNEFFFGGKWVTIREWELQFWRELAPNSLALEAYKAPIDTTFALYNKKYLTKKSFFTGVRVAGDFSARHIPWYPNHPLRVRASDSSVPGRHSNWDEKLSREKERVALENALEKISRIESSFSWKITFPVRSIHRWLRRALSFFRR